MIRTLAACLAALLITACDDTEHAETPFVQDSIEDAARWQIFINRVRDGIYRSYQPLCLDTVKAGHVIEFMNFNPDIPANVTTISAPETLYSPNLMRPYNYVGPNDPENKLCDVEDPAGGCEQRPSWSWWRTRLDTPGTYDWIDTNQGNPGRKVVDPYYGTETFIGLDPNARLGTICVTEEDGTGCEGVCCGSDSDCTDGKICFKSTVDARGRCRTPSG